MHSVVETIDKGTITNRRATFSCIIEASPNGKINERIVTATDGTSTFDKNS